MKIENLMVLLLGSFHSGVNEKVDYPKSPSLIHLQLLFFHPPTTPSPWPSSIPGLYEYWKLDGGNLKVVSFRAHWKGKLTDLPLPHTLYSSSSSTLPQSPSFLAITNIRLDGDNFKVVSFGVIEKVDYPNSSSLIHTATPRLQPSSNLPHSWLWYYSSSLSALLRPSLLAISRLRPYTWPGLLAPCLGLISGLH